MYNDKVKKRFGLLVYGKTFQYGLLGADVALLHIGIIWYACEIYIIVYMKTLYRFTFG